MSVVSGKEKIRRKALVPLTNCCSLQVSSVSVQLTIEILKKKAEKRAREGETSSRTRRGAREGSSRGRKSPLVEELEPLAGRTRRRTRKEIRA